MYGLSDHPNGIPCTRFSAERHGSSRYSTRIPMAKTIEHTFGVPVELEPGVLRVTLPLPSGPRHVPLLPRCAARTAGRSSTRGSGCWRRRGRRSRARLDAPVVRIFITHMHPDHVGGAEAAARVTGAPVLQGRLDYAQCERVWGSGDWPERIADWFLRNGVPPDVAEELIESGHVFADFVRFAWNPTLVDPGDEIDGWRCWRRRGTPTAISASTATGCSSPATTCSRRSRRRSGSTRRAVPTRSATTSARSATWPTLAPRIAFPGHRDPIVDAAARAVEIVAHHDERLDRTEAALGGRAAQRLRRLARAVRAGARRRSSAGSRSRRRSRISSGSSCSAARAARTTA